MQRACFLLKVKSDRLDEYKRHHANACWQKKMNSFFESGSGDMENDALEWIEQIFYLE